MITSRAYPRYRASGLQWIPEVPDHWMVMPSWAIARQVRRSPSAGEGVVTAFRDGQVTLRSNRRTEGFTEAIQEHGYQGVRRGELVIHSMDGFAGAIGVSDSDGKMSPVAHIYSVREGEPRYFALLLRVMALGGFVESLAKGIRERSTAFDRAAFKSLSIPVPPADEQRAILAFLDRETAQIDAFIAKNEELITLLTERRAAVIADAVTGVDRLDEGWKKSGAEWVDVMPKRWSTEQLARTARAGRKTFTDGDWIEAPYITDEGVRLIQTGNVGRGQYKEQGFRYISDDTFRELRCTEVVPGDVLVSRLGDPVARACIAPDLGVRMITSVDVCIIRTREGVDPRWLNYQLNSTPFLDWVGSTVRGSTRDRVSRSMLGKFKVLLPPKDEQLEIIATLDQRVNHIDFAIRTAGRATVLARERRAALISAAVTGKIDVGVAV